MSAIVFARNGQALTTSAIIAEGVNVQHKNILAILRDYRSDFEEFGVFAFETRKLDNPKGGRPETFALLNEQQATLLVTYCKNTEVVRKFKVALVKAFYEMHERLHTTCPAPSATSAYITPEQGYLIQAEVQRRVHRDGVNFQTVYHALKARFKVPKYTFIRTKDFDEAIRFIRTCELRVPTQARPTSLSQPIPEDCLILSGNDAECIVHFIYYWRYLFRPQLEMILKLLRTVNSPMAARFWEAIHELHLPLLEESLRRQGYDVKGLSCYKHLMNS